MKKKLISALLCVSMTAGMLAGCGNSDAKKENKGSSDKDGKTTLTMWCPPLDDDTKGNFDKLLADFKKEKNVDLEIELIPWENYQEKWSTGISNGECPDIGYMYAEMYPTYISSGVVMDMTDLLTEEDRKEFKYLDRGEMMGGQYGMPIVTGVPFVLYYNEDILNELGETPPETWEDFKRICEKATKDTDGDGNIDQYGYAVGLNNGGMSNLYILNSYFYSLLWQAGGDIYNDDLKTVKFNNEAGVEALEFFKSLKDYMPENTLSLPAEDAFSTIFGAGKAAFGVTRSSAQQETLFAETYPDLNWNYVTSLKNKDYGTFGAADSLSIMSTCEEPELAMELIRYICGSEFMTEYHKIAPGAALTVSEEYVGDPKMERIVTEDVDKWRPLQVGPCGSEILENLAAHIQSVMEGKQDVKEALDESAEFADDTLAEYWAENEE
ncbi:ABC transporter substrate-binding protein [Coprococcus sp. AF21-14LB]|uniref:ABC transporter substrate-binding protein n=1 Tax=Coprococcus sp. AF21-14LB TaxID=2292231 RepID=UPI000E4E2019|nr:sugar ABC transporter substrate-binding protein [Coprococcus sp. AF21-14LB]RGS81518.1 sugar ABC transporter substrate-binding protein [Coprococcus sp. AF21-14LB]